MRYLEIPPLPALRAFVHRIWILETSADPEGVPHASPQRILPDGRPELVIHYGDLCRRAHPLTGVLESQARSLMIGQMESSVSLVPGRCAGMIGVRFKPAGAMRFLRSGMEEFSGRIVDFQAWSPRCAAELEDRILHAKNDDKRVELVQDFLVAQLRDGRPDRLLSALIGGIVQTHGTADLRALYERAGISERQAERRFKSAVGLSPKAYSRLIRFRAAAQAIQQRPTADLTSVAHEFGYFDQSHFIHEFKSFAGVPPRGYLAELHPMSDCFGASS